MVLALLCALLVFVSGASSAPAEGSSTPPPEPPVLLGLYPGGNLFTPGDGVDEIKAVDAWIQGQTGSTGKGVSIAAAFVDLQTPNPDWVLRHELGTQDSGVPVGAWDNGYVPFVNVMLNTARSSGEPLVHGSQVANGDLDNAIRAWARVIRDWSQGGARKVFLAPFPEMNGEWVYGWENPSDYIIAFLRMRRIFEEEGVPSNSVMWVFAPNSVSVGRPWFDKYFPGNSAVDVVGLSAYNFGNCLPGAGWQTFDSLLKPALDAVQVMARAKPVFITQMAVPEGAGTYAEKDTWLEQTFSSLAAYPGVRAILYFHRRNPQWMEPNLTGCGDPIDYRFYFPETGSGYQGLIRALQAPDFQRLPPDHPEWTTRAFVPGPMGTFDDAWPAHPFAGVPDVWYYRWVEALARAGVTGGCMTKQISLPGLNSTVSFRFYCPDNPVTRAEMAIFLLKAIEGPAYQPPPAEGSLFHDVQPGDGRVEWADAWIEELARRGFASGFTDGTYRPTQPVTRGQMAVFLLRAVHGAAYQPDPPPAVPTFGDIADHWARPWIEQLYAEGLTSGCKDGTKFCPNDPTSRSQMAAFLTQAFNFPLP